MKRYTREQAAEFLGTSSETMRKWEANGEGPPLYRLSQKVVHYLEKDLSEWLASCRIEPRNDNAEQA